MSQDATDLAVVIPTRDRWDVLQRTLRGLRAQTTQGFAVVVVVDGEDQTVPDLGPGVKVVVKAHGGPGAARNAGVAVADRAVVLLLGDDMIPAADLVERHLDHHRRFPEPEVALLGHVDWHPECGRNRLQRWLDWSGTQFDFEGIDESDAGAGRFYSSNVSVKRSFLMDVGGFDEDFPFVYEDIDLGFRLAGKGMRLHYDAAARTRHLHRYSWSSMAGRFRAIGSGEYFMSRKHPDFAPFFLERLGSRRRAAAVSPWPWLVDLVPGRAGRARRNAERRADAWYMKHLTTAFLTGWTAGGELSDLRRYLGADFDYPRLTARGPASPASPEAVLYDRTARVMAGRYATVVDDITSLVSPGARVLQLGCGTGTLGLHLMDAGCTVTFADRGGAAMSYLHWRLDQRGHAAQVVEVPGLDRPPAGPAGAAAGFDVVLLADLDDAPDPGAVLDAAERVAPAVAVCMPDPGAPRHPDAPESGPLDLAAIRRRARGDLLFRRRRPGDASLVVYATGGDRRAAKARARRWHRPRTPWPPVARS